MFVQSVKKTIRKTPEEEQDGDQRNGVHRFTQGDLRSVSLIIVRAQRSLFPESATRHCIFNFKKLTIEQETFKAQHRGSLRMNLAAVKQCKDPGLGRNLYRTCVSLHANSDSIAWSRGEHCLGPCLSHTGGSE